MRLRYLIPVVVALLATIASARVADITGKWTASFDTPIGVQNYTYEFAVKDGVLTGKAKSENGESPLRNGKVDGDKVTFAETLKFQDVEIEIRYTGRIVSADEIKFSRQVGEFATEELVARRAK